MLEGRQQIGRRRALVLVPKSAPFMRCIPDRCMEWAKVYPEPDVLENESFGEQGSSNIWLDRRPRAARPREDRLGLCRGLEHWFIVMSTAPRYLRVGFAFLAAGSF
jgi:hypothetical protein